MYVERDEKNDQQVIFFTESQKKKRKVWKSEEEKAMRNERRNLSEAQARVRSSTSKKLLVRQIISDWTCKIGLLSNKQKKDISCIRKKICLTKSTGFFWSISKK